MSVCDIGRIGFVAVSSVYSQYFIGCVITELIHYANYYGELTELTELLLNH